MRKCLYIQAITMTRVINSAHIEAEEWKAAFPGAGVVPWSMVVEVDVVVFSSEEVVSSGSGKKGTSVLHLVTRVGMCDYRWLSLIKVMGKKDVLIPAAETGPGP